MEHSIDYEKKLADQISNAANGRLSDREAYASFVAFASKKLNLASQLKTDKNRVDELNRRIRSSGIEDKKFVMIFDTLVDALEFDMDQDLLGRICERLNMTSFKSGQFLTPYPVSKFMAEINISELDTSKQKDIQNIADPCCGTGVMLVAAANVIREKGMPLKNYMMYAQDIDQTMALSCYIQLALQGVPGMVVIGDSLQPSTTPPMLMDEGNAWMLPMTYYYHPELLVDIKSRARKLDKQRKADMLAR